MYILELTVEFSKEQFSGSELSNGISVMLKLLGGTLSEPFNVTILLSSSTATGKKMFAIMYIAMLFANNFIFP